MTPTHLITVLSEEIRAAVKDFKLEAEYQADKKVTVYEQNLDKSNFERDTYYPLVIVELVSMDDDEDDTTATFIITVGVYSGEDDLAKGWRDLANLLNRIREYLLQHRLLRGCLSLKLPLAMDILREQPHPFSFGSLTVAYRTYSPHKITNVVA